MQQKALDSLKASRCRNKCLPGAEGKGQNLVPTCSHRRPEGIFYDFFINILEVDDIKVSSKCSNGLKCMKGRVLRRTVTMRKLYDQVERPAKLLITWGAFPAKLSFLGFHYIVLQSVLTPDQLRTYM